jgi:hypothetical protein
LAGAQSQPPSISLLDSQGGSRPITIFLLCVIPALCYFVGGWVAARAAHARDSRSALAAGALMSIPLSLLTTIGAALASAQIDANALGLAVSTGAGPSLGATFLAVLLPSAAVGALGGAAAVTVPALGRLPRLLLFPLLPLEVVLFPLFDLITGKSKNEPRSAARLWLYDSVVAACLLGVIVVVLDVTGVQLTDIWAWSAVVLTFAVVTALLIAIPLILIVCAVVAALLGTSVTLALPEPRPSYAPAAPYSGPYSQPVEPPYTAPYSAPLPATPDPSGLPTAPPEPVSFQGDEDSPLP